MKICLGTTLTKTKTLIPIKSLIGSSNYIINFYYHSYHKGLPKKCILNLCKTIQNINRYSGTASLFSCVFLDFSSLSFFSLLLLIGTFTEKLCLCGISCILESCLSIFLFLAWFFQICICEK